MGRRGAGLAVGIVMLVFAVPVAAQTGGADAGADVVKELRLLRGAVEDAVRLLKQQAASGVRSDLLREADLLDRNVAFLEQQRSAAGDERRALLEQIGLLDVELESLERQGRSELGEALVDQLRGAKALKADKRALAGERLVELDLRLVELDRALERRRAQREQLERQLDTLMPIE